MAFDLAQYKLLYLQTAWEYLRNLESDLGIFLHEPTNIEAIASAHIAAHSLKSQSLVMHYDQFGMVCRELEDIFKSVKEGKRSLTEADVRILQKVVDSLKESLAQISADDTEIDLKIATEKLASLKSQIGGSG